MRPSRDPREPVRCASGKWFSAPARALVQRWQVADPVEAVRLAAGELLAAAQVSSPPIDLELLGSLRGVVRVDICAMREWGRIACVDEGGFRIWLSSDQSRGRRRFTHAHELGHILVTFEALHWNIQSDSETGVYTVEKEEEYLCDLCASEMLMPLPMFRRVVDGHLPTLESLSTAAQAFDVSLEAAGIRLTQCGLWDCAVIVWEERLKDSQVTQVESNTTLPGMDAYPPEPRLRVRFAARSNGLCHHYFPKQKSLDLTSPIHECLRSGSPLRAKCDLPTGNGPVTFMTESVGCPYRVNGEVRNRIITIACPC